MAVLFIVNKTHIRVQITVDSRGTGQDNYARARTADGVVEGGGSLIYSDLVLLPLFWL